MLKLDLEKAEGKKKKEKKGRGNKDQIANTRWIIEKAREFQKNISSAKLTTPKPLTVWITTNYKIL